MKCIWRRTGAYLRRQKALKGELQRRWTWNGGYGAQGEASSALGEVDGAVVRMRWWWAVTAVAFAESDELVKEDGDVDGKERFVSARGSVYEVERREGGVLHGSMKSQDGCVWYEGGLRDVKDKDVSRSLLENGFQRYVPDGKGCLVVNDENGALVSRYEGEFENGNRQGSGVLWIRSMSSSPEKPFALRYEGTFADGAPHGQVEISYFDAKGSALMRYEGEMQHGMKHGHGSEFRFQGACLLSDPGIRSIYDGSWEADAPRGEGSLSFIAPDGLVLRTFIGEWNGHLDLKSGTESKFENGEMILYNGNFKDIAYHGEGTLLFASPDTSSWTMYQGEWDHGHLINGVETDSEGTFYKGDFKYSFTRHGQGTLQILQEDGSPSKTITGEWEDGAIRRGRETRPDGSVYEGEFMYNGKWHGSGCLTLPDGSKSDGKWSYGLKNGPGSLKTSDGEVFDGEWSRGLEHGKGRLTRPDGSTIEAEWKHGLVHGNGTEVLRHNGVEFTFEGEYRAGERLRGTLTCAEDETEVEMEIVAGEMLIFNAEVVPGERDREAIWSGEVQNGVGTAVLDDGSVYEGELKNGRAEGEGRMICEDASKRFGQWKQGMMNGEGSVIFPDGCAYKGMMKDDLAHGQGKMSWARPWTSSLEISYEGEWRRGLQYGYGKSVFTNGSSYEGCWKNGFKHGQGRVIFPDQRYYQGKWFQGSPPSHGTISYPDGSMYEGGLKHSLAFSLFAWPIKYWSFPFPLKHGQGKFTLANGETQQGRWAYGLFLGPLPSAPETESRP